MIKAYGNHRYSSRRLIVESNTFQNLKETYNIIVFEKQYRVKYIYCSLYNYKFKREKLNLIRITNFVCPQIVYSRIKDIKVKTKSYTHFEK